MVLSFPQYAHPYEPTPGFSRYAPYPPALGALDPQSQQIAGIAATAATSTAGILVAIGTIGGPIGAAIAGIAAIGVAIANVFSGCGQVCVQTADIDNQVEAILDQNFNHYMGAPVHYASMQAAALNNFDIAWQAYTRAELAYGSQGQLSMTQRQAGGCRYKVAPFGWTQNADGSWSYVNAGSNGSGTTCWNWFSGLRDPIANDPTVVPDPVLGAPSGGPTTVVNPNGTISVIPTVGGVSLTPLLIGAGVILAALMMGGGN